MTNLNKVDINKDQSLLSGVQHQTSGFDTKACTLLGITGLVFAVSMCFLNVFQESFYTNGKVVFTALYTVFYVIYLLATLFALFSFTMVLIPRDNHTSVKYPNYFMDITEMGFNDLRNAISEYNSSDDMFLGQLLINSRICRTKYSWLFKGITALVPFIISLLVMCALLLIA